MPHCKSDFADFNFCMAVYGLQQFSCTDTTAFVQSEYLTSSQKSREAPYKCICVVSSVTCLCITIPVRLLSKMPCLQVWSPHYLKEKWFVIKIIIIIASIHPPNHSLRGCRGRDTRTLSTVHWNFSKSPKIGKNVNHLMGTTVLTEHLFWDLLNKI